MARHLALDWDHQQLRIVAATARAGQLHIEQAAVWPEEQSPNVAEAESLGRRLRERLRSAGIAPAPVLACVGRDRVILREVRYPSVAAAEEPAVVRFQVLKELSDAAHEVVIDYAPLGEVGLGEERRALVLTVRRELLQAYQTLCRSAGLKLHALTPRPFGTLACLRACAKDWPGSSSSSGPHKDGSVQPALAVLTAAERWSEFCLVRGDTLLVARSLPAGPGLAAEVRRNIVVYSAQSPRHVVSGLYLAGNGDNGTLQECLQRSLDIPVRSFDPLAGAEGTVLAGQNRGAFAGAVGLLHAQADERPLPINFVSPKQPGVARNPNKRRLALAAGMAALFLLGIVSYCYSDLAALDRAIEAKSAEKIGLDSQILSQIGEDEEHLKELAEWSRGNIPWLDELYNLTVLVPDLRMIQVSSIDGAVQPAASGAVQLAAKNKPIAKMDLKILATNDDPVADLLKVMTKDKHYLPGIKRQLTEAVKEPPFTKLFEAPIEVEKQPPDEYKQHLTGSVAQQGPQGLRTKFPLAAYKPTSPGNDVPDSRIAKPEMVNRVKYVTPPPTIDNSPKTPAQVAGPVQPAPASPVYDQIKEAFSGAAPATDMKPPVPAIDPARRRQELIERQKARGAIRSAPPAAGAPAKSEGKKQ